MTAPKRDALYQESPDDDSQLSSDELMLRLARTMAPALAAAIDEARSAAERGELTAAADAWARAAAAAPRAQKAPFFELALKARAAANDQAKRLVERAATAVAAQLEQEHPARRHQLAAIEAERVKDWATAVDEWAAAGRAARGQLRKTFAQRLEFARKRAPEAPAEDDAGGRLVAAAKPFAHDPRVLARYKIGDVIEIERGMKGARALVTLRPEGYELELFGDDGEVIPKGIFKSPSGAAHAATGGIWNGFVWLGLAPRAEKPKKARAVAAGTLVEYAAAAGVFNAIAERIGMPPLPTVLQLEAVPEQLQAAADRVRLAAEALDLTARQLRLGARALTNRKGA